MEDIIATNIRKTKQGRHPEKALSAAFVRTVTKPGRYLDGHGLSLLVLPSGGRCWVQRLVIRGKRRELGLGGYPLVPLAEARERAFANRKLARSGGDPLAEKRKAQGTPSFKEAAAAVIALNRPNWRSAKHAKQWEATLRDYAFPRLAERPVSEVTTPDVLAILTPLWNEKRETARRLRQRLGAIFEWATVQGHRPDDPVAGLRRVLPKNPRSKKHHRALPHGEVAAAIKTVRSSDAFVFTKLAIEFAVLTAARSGEVRLATWDEIDVDARVWTIPAERMKSNREHRVPLSWRALEILNEARALANGSGFVFPSPRGRVLSDSTLSKLVRELDIGCVPHGFRSSFRDWAAECTNAPREVQEAALAHVVTNKTEAAYARSDLFDRRRTLMDQWAAYLSEKRGKVVELVRSG